MLIVNICVQISILEVGGGSGCNFKYWNRPASVMVKMILKKRQSANNPFLSRWLSQIPILSPSLTKTEQSSPNWTSRTWSRWSNKSESTRGSNSGKWKFTKQLWLILLQTAGCRRGSSGGGSCWRVRWCRCHDPRPLHRGWSDQVRMFFFFAFSSFRLLHPLSPT